MNAHRSDYFEKTLSLFDMETRRIVEGIVGLVKECKNPSDFKTAVQSQYNATHSLASGTDTLQINGAFIIYFAPDNSDTIRFEAVTLGPLYTTWPPQYSNPLPII